jgi:hypothetical protein
LYDTQEDKSCYADLWFETIEEALEYCTHELDVEQEQWVVIIDPKEGQYHDIISPLN